MRISDWSSDVCSSDLNDPGIKGQGLDLHPVHFQDAGSDEAFVDSGAVNQATLGKTTIARGKVRVAVQQMLQISVQETVAPHRREQLLQIEALILDGGDRKSVV